MFTLRNVFASFVVLSMMAVLAPADPYTLAPNADAAVAGRSGGPSDRAIGADIHMVVGQEDDVNTTDWSEAMVRFDLSGIGSASSSGTFTLTPYLYVGAAAGHVLSIYAMPDTNADWVEGVGLGNSGTIEDPGACWHRKAGGFSTPTAWVGGSPEYNMGSSVASHTITSGDVASPSALTFTIPQATLTAACASGRISFLIQSDNKGIIPQIDARFYTKENGSGAPSLAFTGSPVPEPSTIALLATGLIGLLAYAWRKRK
jgi:hypothetical protein